VSLSAQPDEVNADFCSPRLQTDSAQAVARGLAQPANFLLSRRPVRTLSYRFGPRFRVASEAFAKKGRPPCFLFTTANSLGRFRRRRLVSGRRRIRGGIERRRRRHVDTGTATAQVNAFVLTNGGLMAGATVDGAKVTRLNRL
jgi:hypothetical protein